MSRNAGSLYLEYDTSVGCFIEEEHVDGYQKTDIRPGQATCGQYRFKTARTQVQQQGA